MGAMIQLLIKAIELLRRNPVLWLPYLSAELLAIGLWRLWGIVRTAVFQWFTTRRSVLGGAVANTDHSALANASMVSLPIGLVTVFAIVSLFVVAYMATAGMVEAISQERRVDLRETLVSLVSRWQRGLLFSLTFLFVIGISLAAATALLFFVLYLLHRPDLRISPIAELGEPFFYVGCAAWLVMPMAIRLLGTDRTVRVSSRTRNLGAIAAILSAETGVALGMILQRVEQPIFLDTQWEFTALAIFNSIVANAPDILLFIALSLLALENSEVADSGQEIGFRQLKQTFMPMHFPEEKEPE